MPSYTEEVKCPECGRDIAVEVETQYESDVRVTSIKREFINVHSQPHGTWDTGGNDTFTYEPPSVIRDIIASLKRTRCLFDDFNLALAKLRVKKGMSNDMSQHYKMMEKFDRDIREIITDAEIISESYSRLIDEDEKP